MASALVNASNGPAAGRVSAALTPSAPKAASPASPAASQRRASTPITAAKTASRTRMPLMSAVLSGEPTCGIANP